MMKTLFLTTLYMGFSFVVLASADPSPAKPESCLVAPVLAKHLPNGVWLGTSADGQKLSVVFYENGVAQWNEGAGQVPEVALYGWEVIPGVGGCAFLQMTGQASGNTYSYAVDVKCNQLQLIATDFSAHSLKQIKAGNGEKYRQLLSGAWGNTTYPFEVSLRKAPDMEDAYLQYQFSEDGTFVRKLGNGNRKLEEAGSYLVSDDGHYVLLQFDNSCITVVALKYLQLDELVLQHVLRCEDPAFATGRKDFYFNKL
ncbi:hypothetical protein [Phaeodactylibacter xiamenensis]|uniref:hypothetical protein n=1 Tax=Phaeodactylibacter xiamenensis TaxID=1524460 RepID=UPI003CCBE959